MGCSACGQRYRGRAGASRLRHGTQRFRRGVVQVATTPTPAVIDQPMVNKSDTATPSPTGEILPFNGMAKSIVENGTDPTNFISQPLPEAVNPTVVDAQKGAAGTYESDESNPAVIPTPGAS